MYSIDPKSVDERKVEESLIINNVMKRGFPLQFLFILLHKTENSSTILFSSYYSFHET
jgi:hypothetical protein